MDREPESPREKRAFLMPHSKWGADLGAGPRFPAAQACALFASPSPLSTPSPFSHVQFPLLLYNCSSLFGKCECLSELQVWSFFFFVVFRATPAAYGGSQCRGPIEPVASSLHHSHSSAGSEPCLQPTPQLMAMQDP